MSSLAVTRSFPFRLRYKKRYRVAQETSKVNSPQKLLWFVLVVLDSIVRQVESFCLLALWSLVVCPSVIVYLRKLSLYAVAGCPLGLQPCVRSFLWRDRGSFIEARVLPVVVAAVSITENWGEWGLSDSLGRVRVQQGRVAAPSCFIKYVMECMYRDSSLPKFWFIDMICRERARVSGG